MLLRLLQQSETLGMPQAESLSIIGPRCGALHVRDEVHHWRISYRIDPDAIVIVEVHSKKTRKLPDEVIERCRKHLKACDDIC